MRTALPPVAPGQKQYAVGKSPAVALILSILIPGVGQFYNNDVKKGAIMLGAAIVGGAITLGVAWLGILIWSAIDAYQVASGKSPLW
jgi:TM2 domain-containing membrane protein YozV